ncbi:MAG: glycosyltransferase family 2 protein [Candidatus Accumulibacter sp.]|uniref:glycosyltransferase family 2 protein n=1 Tax=Accumulibacter sp. TaxID=2053492 RepID=UPI0019EBEA7F|nr:glycosyltransferase family 2 protein [Accumulibacter sp.]MBE2260235.1 glycosyltransferase family 2 protein [Paracoccaceae bacterium]MCB1943329.1 glycosyltransferase family 2 protein [Accumulibacter sp.]MCP5248793.1 glycosyltransferase family 2 protein [Accumulibacter sp.]
MKLISVVTGCFNEEENVDELYRRIRAQFEQLPAYDYEHIFIDNASSDGTVARIKAIAARDRRVKLIVNTRNFGHIRSPVHALLQARGDAIIAMASDLQEPPELIPEFLARWEQGYRVVAGVKPSSAHTTAMSFVRRSFYATIGRISDTRLIPNFTGFGLYDRAVVEIIRQTDDPYPYFRGLIADIGFEHAEVPFVQPRRSHGISKNNFYTLYDMAILGITSHSKIPIRLATMAGFALSALSLLVAITYLIYKLVSWEQFSVGIAPVVIGFFFFASVQLFFIGILGEYIAAIHTQVLKRPLVIEKERVNFDSPASD